MARSPDANRVLQAVRAVVGVRADRDSGRGSGNWRSGSESGKWWVAFSGGVDSSVLLDAAARVLGGQAATGLAAVHVNHGLHPDAGDWEDHCRTVADGLGIRLEVRRVAVSGERGQGGSKPRPAWPGTLRSGTWSRPGRLSSSPITWTTKRRQCSIASCAARGQPGSRPCGRRPPSVACGWFGHCSQCRGRRSSTMRRHGAYRGSRTLETLRPRTTGTISGTG